MRHFKLIEDVGNFQYTIILTAEEAELIKNHEVSLFEVEGNKVFEVRNKLGKSTGQKAIYVTFIKKEKTK